MALYVQKFGGTSVANAERLRAVAERALAFGMRVLALRRTQKPSPVAGVEVARELSVTEGQVLSIRRAGLRRIWRWLGRDLPPRVREVWEERFKGSTRRSPDQVAQKLGIDVGEVMEHLAEARQLTGVG